MRTCLVVLLCCVLGVVGFDRAAFSADIEWQFPAFDIETDEDIDLSGTNILAFNVVNPDEEDIIDVEIGDQVLEFEPVNPEWGGITATSNFYSGQDQALTTGNEELDMVLDSHGWRGGGEGTDIELILEDLTVGTNYQIQLIGAADDRSCCEQRRVVVVDDDFDFVSDFFGRQTDWDEDGEAGPGSVIGTFVADETEQVITIIGTSDAPDGGPPNDPGLSAYILSEATAGGQPLQAGDADMDCDFDQLDLVKVQVAGKYLSGQAATWGEGDWDGAPGGSVEDQDPPAGNGLFDQLDIISALNANIYLSGSYCADGGLAAIAPGGAISDGQTSIVYNANTGEIMVDSPASTNLTSVNIDSASGIFVDHENAQNLDGSFDNDANDNIFKATFGDSFGDISFGEIAALGLEKSFVANDLTVVGSLEGGGGLGDVDLVYIPEPSTALLLGLGLVMMLIRRRR